MEKVAVKKFLKLLEIAKPGLSKKEIIEQSTHFVFEDGRLYTFNDEVAVCVPVPISIKGAVQAQEFFSFLHNVKERYVRIIAEDEILHIKGKTFQANFNLLKPSLPISEIKYPDEWRPLPDNFKELFHLSGTCVSRDVSVPILTCIHFKSNYLESCDNFKLVRVYLPEELGFDALIAGSVPSLLSSYETPLYIGETDVWLHFKTNDDCIFSCRRFEGNYPDLDHLLGDFKEDVVINFPKNLIDVLNRAEPLAMEDEIGNKYVDIGVTREHMVIYTNNYVGSFTEKIEIENKKNINFRTRIDTLKTVLKLYEKAYVNDEADRLLFRSDTMTHLIALK